MKQKIVTVKNFELLEGSTIFYIAKHFYPIIAEPYANQNGKILKDKFNAWGWSHYIYENIEFQIFFEKFNQYLFLLLSYYHNNSAHRVFFHSIERIDLIRPIFDYCKQTSEVNMEDFTLFHCLNFIKKNLDQRVHELTEKECELIKTPINKYKNHSREDIITLAKSIYNKLSDFRYHGLLNPLPFTKKINENIAYSLSKYITPLLFVDGTNDELFAEIFLNKKFVIPDRSISFHNICPSLKVKNGKYGYLCFVLKQLNKLDLIRTKNLWVNFSQSKIFIFGNSFPDAQKYSNRYSDFMDGMKIFIDGKQAYNLKKQKHRFVKTVLDLISSQKQN